VFGSSGDHKDRKHTWLVEITDGRVLELKSDQIPAWFKRSVRDKIKPPPAGIRTFKMRTGNGKSRRTSCPHPFSWASATSAGPPAVRA
jgi:hypothetical protein